MTPSTKLTKQLVLAALSLLAPALIGCGRGNYPEVATVTGVVLLDGKPLEGAEVTFAPREGRSSTGLTDHAGKYALSYTKKVRGAVLGQHTVKISKIIQDFTKSPTKYDAAVDRAQNALLESQGIPLVVGKSADAKSGDGPLPLEPLRIQMVPNQYVGSESVLTATVEPRGNVIDFDLSSDAED
jgi:hypothetical protein